MDCKSHPRDLHRYSGSSPCFFKINDQSAERYVVLELKIRNDSKKSITLPHNDIYVVVGDDNQLLLLSFPMRKRLIERGQDPLDLAKSITIISGEEKDVKYPMMDGLLNSDNVTVKFNYSALPSDLNVISSRLHITNINDLPSFQHYKDEETGWVDKKLVENYSTSAINLAYLPSKAHSLLIVVYSEADGKVITLGPSDRDQSGSIWLQGDANCDIPKHAKDLLSNDAKAVPYYEFPLHGRDPRKLTLHLAGGKGFGTKDCKVSVYATELPEDDSGWGWAFLFGIGLVAWMFSGQRRVS